MFDQLRQAETFGLTLSRRQIEQFEQYYHLLIAANQRMNLTRITDPTEVLSKHFLDSLSIYSFLSKLSNQAKLIDVGTGAGLPGLALKIASPELRLTLLDSVGKKVAFLEQVVSELGLTDVVCLKSRAEDAGHHPAHRQQYDLVVARAVAALPTLLEYLLPFAKPRGLVIAQKGQSAPDEVVAAQAASRLLGGSAPKRHPIAVPGLDAKRYLVTVHKHKHTPKQYPRQAGTPKKSPLG